MAEVLTKENAPERLGRDARQRDLVPPEKLAGVHALVVGVGAIGKGS